MSVTKRCRSCEVEKPLGEFNVQTKNKDGYRSLCRPCQRRYNAEYRRTSGGKLVRAFHVAKARAKKFEVRDDLTMEELRVAYRFSKNRGCVYCGGEIGDDFSVDHVIPMSKGAHNSFWNIVVCHDKCNYRKHNKPASEFVSKEKMDEITFDMIVRSPYHEEAITNFLCTGEFKGESVCET